MELLKELNPAMTLSEIKVSFTEMEETLQAMLEDYKDIVVTQTSLSAAKEDQRKLASMRTQIETFRKEKKREMEKPIKSFEEQCKALIQRITEVEEPLKEGIAVFDHRKKREKEETALKLIRDAVTAYGLRDEFANQLGILPAYLNLTATKKKVREDIENRAASLKAKQDREDEILGAVRATIADINAKVTQKLTVEDYEDDIIAVKYGFQKLEDLIAKITKRGNGIVMSEKLVRDLALSQKPKEDVKPPAVFHVPDFEDLEEEPFPKIKMPVDIVEELTVVFEGSFAAVTRLKAKLDAVSKEVGVKWKEG